MVNPISYVWLLAVAQPWPVVFVEAAAGAADPLALKLYHPVP